MSSEEQKRGWEQGEGGKQIKSPTGTKCKMYFVVTKTKKAVSGQEVKLLLRFPNQFPSLVKESNLGVHTF